MKSIRDDPSLSQHAIDFLGGNIFQRLKPVLISPATTYVEVTPSSSSIEVPLCDQIDAEFNIYNYGPATSIVVEISDDLGFLMSPSSIRFAN